MLNVKTNRELSQVIENIIDEKGIKKTWLAEQLGVANQNINKLINKKSISLDDANRILSALGYEASICIEKK